MADNVVAVSDSNFQAEVIEASKTQPVMVDFWAELVQAVPDVGAHRGRNRHAICRQIEGRQD